MIKLKDIIKEIISQNTLWNTPTDTPDEVIDIMHQIIAHIMDTQGLKANPIKHVKLRKVQDMWQIFRPDKSKIYLIYDPVENLLWAPVYDTTNHIKMITLDKSGLELKIENWLI